MNNFVSIIIPTLNAERYIRKCLTSIGKLDYPKDKLEVIVVDGGSDDRTKDIAKQYNVIWLERPAVTISAQRNYGADYAKGDILAFVDSDCIVPSYWAKKGMEIIEDTKGITAVGAQYKLPENPSWVEKIWDMHMDLSRVDGEVKWLPSCNMLMPKEVFEKVKGFNKYLITSEDVDLCKKLRDAGYKIISSNLLAVIHMRNPKTIKEFFLKELWRGKGSVQEFISALPEIHLTKAKAFALFMLLCLFFALAGVVIWAIAGNPFILLISLISMLLLPFALALRVAQKSDKVRYLLPLAFLYLVYGAARALSFLDYRVWKTAFKKTSATILSYHDVVTADASMANIASSLKPYILPSRDFEKQLELIKSEGLSVISLASLVNHDIKSINKSVVVTFDDGLANNYHVAYPLLKKYGFTATFFVIAGKVGENGMMTWEQLKELTKNKMTIGSHTLTHRYPSELSGKEIEYELAESKRILEDKLGVKIDLLSIPTGFHNKKMLDMAKSAGYTAVCSGVEGITNLKKDNFALKSFCVRNGISDEEFIGILHNDRVLIARRRLRQAVLKAAKRVLGVVSYNRMREFILGKV